MLRMSSSTISTLRPASPARAAARCSMMRRLSSRHACDAPVQEQRGLVEQLLVRLGTLEDERLDQVAQLRLLRGAQVLGGVNDDRQAARAVATDGLDQLQRRPCPAAPGRARRNRTIARCSACNASRAGADARDVTSPLPMTFRISPRCRSSSSTSSSSLTGRARNSSVRASACCKRRVIHRLFQHRERAHLQAALARIVDGDDVDRDVPRVGAALENVEQAPAVHVRQVDVESDQRRAEAAHQRQRAAAGRRHDGLEAAIVRQVEQDAAELRVVLDDQQHARRRAGCSAGRRSAPLRTSSGVDSRLTTTCARLRRLVAELSAVMRTSCAVTLGAEVVRRSAGTA